MNPQSSVLSELQPLLDALCDETITPEQLRRMEELVLQHPEAQSQYIAYLSLHADIIGQVAGLPEPKQGAEASHSPAPAQSQQGPDAPRSPRVEPAKKPEKKRARSVRGWKLIAWALLIGTVALGGYQGFAWASRAGDVRDAERAVDSRRAEVAAAQAEQAAAIQAARKPVEDAVAAEQKLVARFREAYENARKAIENKDFVVRLTGPTHVEPGAPNKWQIETLRHGAVGRPKKLDVIVKDEKDTELYRKTELKTVGVTNLELAAAFWDKVKPGSDLFLEVVAYTDDDRRSVLADRLPLARPVYITHLVTDKPLYQPGETIRFRSLTLDRSTLLPPEHDLHLSFRLRDPGDAVTPLGTGNGRLLHNLKPVLGPDGQPLRGIGVGEHVLSPDAPGGEYKLDLYERSPDTGKDVLLETRKFIVNRYVPDIFEKKLEFDGKSYGPGEAVQARIEVSRTAGGPMPNATAVVVAAAAGKPFFEQQNLKFTAITDAAGTKTILDVRFKLPAEVFQAEKPNATLSVTIRDGSDVEAIVRPIPLVTKNLLVEFFPEGGDMIEGVPGRVYFMVRTPAGKPADLKGIITDGTTTITEVATLTDAENPGVNRGHGVFTLTPQSGKRYFLKLTSPTGINAPAEGYPLPQAKPDGVALTALDAVTPRGGAIRLRLQSPRGPKTLHVGAYARGRLIAHEQIEVKANTPAEVALQGDATAGGVTRVTVFEEPGEGGALIPRAERLVFRGPGQQLILNAKPDRPRYSPSDRVRLDLAATNENGQPTPAVLLVGVVNRSVITMADNKNDRLQSTHFLLSGEVKNSAELEHADFLLTDHPKAGIALDLLLGTQGWRRFAEQDMAPANPSDRPHVDEMLVAHGQRPTAPLQLVKLEEQRISAEFAPQIEQARLNIASAEESVKTAAAPASERLNAARVALSVAESWKSETTAALNEVKERFTTVRNAFVGALAVAVVVSFLVFALILAFTSMTAPEPIRRRRRYIAGVFFLAVCGLVFLALGYLGTQVRYSVVRTSGKLFPAEETATDAAPGPRGGSGAMNSPRRMREAAVPNAKPPMLNLDKQVAPLKAGPREPINRVGIMREAALPPIAQGPMPGQAAAELLLPFLEQENVLQGHGLARTMFAKDGVPAPPTIPPFIVREYAHERDPALGEVRSDFTETVYWHPVLVLPENGKTSVEFQLSDDIARYQVLVAGHTLDGRVGAITTTIEARKPFSLDPKLPLEISHTDTIDVPVRATNDSDVRRNIAYTATVAGFKTDGPLSDIIDLGPNATGRKILRLNANLLDGNASVKLEGTSIPAAPKDVIARTIRVVPDGFPRVGTFSDMLENGRARSSFTLPKDVVPGSLRVRLEMYPTSMADLVNGLDGLLREPYGCFEQTSTTNYPNTMILQYLNETDQANPAVASRARDLLARGYGRLTSFECPDTPQRVKHGFEWFGKADMQHEALTAYGLLQFKDMARVHPVDPALIRRTQEFLLSRRDGQGGFHQRAGSLHSWSGAKHLVNAYILWALVESDPDDAEHLDLKTEIAAIKAEVLEENSTGGKDPYFVALAANVMLLRNEREAAHRLLDRLQEKHFQDGAVTGAKASVVQSGGRDLRIEVTALAMLGWLRANDPKYAMTIKAATKWISQQRGGYGGFGSTQSTILALKALSLHAAKMKHPAEDGELRLLVGGKVVGSRNFTKDDVNVIGLDIANPETVFALGGRNEVEIATGAKQPYPFALSYTYTCLTPVSAEECAVRISTKLAKAEAAEGETVPLEFTLENVTKDAHGMAVAIIGLPAGMKVPTDMKQLTDLREKGQIAYFETRGRELILYWRSLGPEQKIALSIDLVCDVPGVYRGPASRGYLYYNADHKHWVEPLSIRITP